MSADNLLNKLYGLIKPIVCNLNYELYHLEIVKEENENYLRIYIDKEDSGISLEDCEKVSRAVSDMLDVEDPISFSYYLEVSSPGIERTLYTDEHLKRYIGSEVRIKIDGLLKGKKEYEGELLNFDQDNLQVKINDEDVDVPRNKILNVSLKVNF
ncbi:ribosome maturation factor RimP [Clostridium algifaecis]|uniref:Ribosome maturation factor RimP n=1 Tax=Clostridium algifaecis TaxID=1472040 RepID=A0ABS4KNQ5_9CLOT|nr:ribosome maturation factor RimP [Clostridium algifaecis]MBP2031665.1 ribosome maturation factor RimP [Clostridium algifaecis]